MKSESLLSQRSNLSQLSNVSYHGEKKQYIGSEFFRESLTPGQNQNIFTTELKQQQIQLDSLGVGFFKNFTHNKQPHPSAFTPFWTSELHHHNIEGTSDNENDHEHELEQPAYAPISLHATPKQEPPQVKVEERVSRIAEVDDFSEMEDESEKDEQEDREGNLKVLKNETKNIPKNYGKAIIIFIENNRKLIEDVLIKNGDSYDCLISRLRTLKKKINTISDLRNLWENQPESRSLRTISNNFLRKHSLHYIYNSRIKTRLCHAKYKRRLQEAIVNPQDFNHIKDY